MNRNCKKKYLIPAAVCLLTIGGLLYYYFLSSFSSHEKTTYVYVDSDDDVDSVVSKVKPLAKEHALAGFCTLLRHSNYAEHIRTGCYAIEPGQSVFTVFRHIKNGLQTPISLTIPSVRTLERLSAELSKRLMVDSTAIITALKDSATCHKYGYDTATVVCMFIPNTYDVYWNTTVSALLDRMYRESEVFWTADRLAKAKHINMTPIEVMTLASIVDEETANDREKPMIAGMYYNRLTFRDAEYPEGMPLQADPTIKFALKRFDLHRIYHRLLSVKSPYNTYLHPGLPPGPIRIPNVNTIDAVLNYTHHDYLYMCAKPDFSGTHNFSHTYQEHLQRAEEYARALNERGIK